jgi:diguanylate cyclase (GGDEF)-like protein
LPSLAGPFPAWLRHSRATGVARLRTDGRIVHFNEAFLAQAGEASWLLEPELDLLQGEDGDASHDGKIVLGDLEGKEFSIFGRLYREDDGWLLVCEAGNRLLDELRGEVARLQGRVDEMAHQDGLTGLANRAQLDRRADEEILRWERYHRPLSLVLLDMDGFSTVNARYGREAADEALVHVATLLKQSIRALDLAARYGGEEFALLLPETNAMGAMIVAKRLQLDLESHILLPLVEPLTASFGVAMMLPDEPREAFFARAAAALRASKEKGRNRVTVA